MLDPRMTDARMALSEIERSQGVPPVRPIGVSWSPSVPRRICSSSPDARLPGWEHSCFSLLFLQGPHGCCPWLVQPGSLQLVLESLLSVTSPIRVSPSVTWPLSARAKAIPLRSAPADQSPAVTRLPSAAPVQILQQRGEWTFCSAPSGEKGWAPNQIARTRRARCVNPAFAVALLAAIVLSVCHAAEPWRDRLGPETLGPFPPVRPFSGEFRFGWSDIAAASAKARLWYSGDLVIVEVEGGTDGLARTLWQLDARHKATILKEGLKPVGIRASRELRQENGAHRGGLQARRSLAHSCGYVRSEERGKWKKIKVEPIRDIVSAMLFIRSQVLNDGDKIGIVAFPGDAPFLVEVTVAKHEQLRVGDSLHKVIKLDFQIQRIDTKNKNRLAPHGKFKNGTVWISDDENRIPLRAEVDIFIGYVFGELQSIRFE